MSDPPSLCLQPSCVWVTLGVRWHSLLAIRSDAMVKHQFGGSWTTEKLERVRKYLVAYTKIFRTNVRAQYFQTTYVDAFAGTGARIDATADHDVLGGSLFGLIGDSDVDSFKKGSARIALEV